MKKFKWIILLILISISMFLIMACDFNNISNPADKLEIRVKNIARETFVSFEILDAKTNSQINEEIFVEISGRDNGLVINEINEPTVNFTVENGILLFAIADGVVPSKESPVKLNILLKGDDFLSTSQPILVTKAGMNTFSAVMTNVDNTPAGVVSNQENVGNTNANNGLADSTVVSSGEDGETGGEASISMAQGTKLKDGNGNVLSGSVETRVTYFNPLNEESLAAFPGGFSVELESGDEGNFTTAGFVAVDMSVNGTEVEQFDGNVNIDIKVPEGTMNPETGQPVKPGDIIPVYSYDEDNGIWKFEGNATVPEQSNLGKSTGTHSISIKNVTHLSYWNLDWYGSGRCYNYPKLTFQSTTGTFQSVKVKICRSGTQNAVSWWAEKNVYSSDAAKELYGFPTNAGPVTVRVYSNYSGDEIGSLDIPELCVRQDFIVNFTDIDLLNVNLEVQIKCDEAAVTPDGLPLYARKYGTDNWKNLGSVSNGTIQGVFIPNEYYDFAVNFDGQWYFTKDYAEDIISRAADSGYTLEQNSYGYLKMSTENADITILLQDIKSICDEF